jgi:hypothetical protein
MRFNLSDEDIADIGGCSHCQVVLVHAQFRNEVR